MAAHLLALPRLVSVLSQEVPELRFDHQAHFFPRSQGTSPMHRNPDDWVNSHRLGKRAAFHDSSSIPMLDIPRSGRRFPSFLKPHTHIV